MPGFELVSWQPRDPEAAASWTTRPLGHHPRQPNTVPYRRRHPTGQKGRCDNKVFPTDTRHRNDYQQ